VPPSSALPAATNTLNPSPGDAVRDEELALLRKLALTKKHWWQEPAILIAAMAFLLSLVTTIISAWTSHQKDIHDQQEQLVKLILDMKDLRLQWSDISNQYKNDPGTLSSLRTTLATQERAIQRYAVALARSLGSNASTGEFVILAQDSVVEGNMTEAVSLYELAISASASPLDVSWALRNLAGLEMRFDSPEMRTAGNANYQRLVDLDAEYPDLNKEVGLKLFVKTIGEFEWGEALMRIDCKEARLHFDKAQSHLSSVPVVFREGVERNLTDRNVSIQGGKILAPACPATSSQ
jgi:hypothetical protein